MLNWVEPKLKRDCGQVAVAVLSGHHVSEIVAV